MNTSQFFTVISLIGITLLATSCEAQSRCRNLTGIPTAQNFTSDRIMSEWYVHEVVGRTPEDVADYAVFCSYTHEVYDAWVGRSLHEIASWRNDSGWYTDTHSLDEYVENPAIWHLTYFWGIPNDGETTLVVVDTDYDNYWLEYRCTQDNAGVQHDRIFILTKESRISDDDLRVFETQVEELGFNLENGRKIPNCNDT